MIYKFRQNWQISIYSAFELYDFDVYSKISDQSLYFKKLMIVLSNSQMNIDLD